MSSTDDIPIDPFSEHQLHTLLGVVGLLEGQQINRDQMEGLR